MSEENPASRTMRIDIDPTTLVGPSPAKRPRRRPAAPAFVAGRRGRATRDTPYDKLLESIYDGVFITDRRGMILDYNDRAAEFFRLDEDHLLGLAVVELISGADERLLDTILVNLEKSRYTLIEARCTRSDGTSFPAEIAVNKVDLDASGQLCFFVRDVTVRRQAQEALQEAIERLQAHDRARMEFVSNVSHELRTPLTSMIYAVNNMLRGVVGPLPEKALRYLERLESDCRRLLATVNDILDLRQLESGTLTLVKTLTPLTHLTQSTVDGLRIQAEAKRQRLIFEPPARECFALCDQQKIERVITNVVGNAIKYTHEEGVITVSVAYDPENPNSVLISVADNGIGIPSDAIAKVTQRYFRIGDQPNGSGLGLSISRELVELHGGALTIASPPPRAEKGTYVAVRLLAAPPPTVLIATPDDAIRATLQQMIGASGYLTATAAAGREVLTRCAEQPPDLLLLDLRLPDVDGVEVVLQLRNDKRTQRLPLLVLSRDTVARPTIDILQRFSIPILAMPWRDGELLNRVAAAFINRGLLGKP